MDLYRAAWVLPIAAPPIREGWVAVDRGRILACGSQAERWPGAKREPTVIDLGARAVLPGLVNAHTHLELSHLGGRIPPTADFVQWIRAVLRARAQPPEPAEQHQAVERAMSEAVRTGTVLVGDVSNTLVTVAPLSQSPLAAVIFHELLGFNPASPERAVTEAIERLRATERHADVRLTLATHAPYSVALETMMAIGAAHQRGELGSPCCVHLAESRAELEFVATAEGPWRTLLEELGAWNPGWTPRGETPVQYLDRIGAFGAHRLAVHAVHVNAADLRTLSTRGVTIVSCPRSNRLTGAGVPPVQAFYEAGVPVAVGTDSLATVPDLNLFAELAELRRLAPTVPASRLLASATRQGAAALGFEADFGTLAPGRRAALLAVAIPPGLDDVEEYLVSGIAPESVSWARANQTSERASGTDCAD